MMRKITIIIKMRKRYENMIISRELSLMDEFSNKLLIFKDFSFNPFLLLSNIFNFKNKARVGKEEHLFRRS